MDQDGIKIQHAQVTPESARQIEEIMDGARRQINDIIKNDPVNAAPPPEQTGVVLSWQPPLPDSPKVQGYNIWRNDGVNWREIVPSTQNSNTTYRDTDPLVANKWYWYAVRALTEGGGVGEWSAVISHLHAVDQAGPPRRFQANAMREQESCCQDDEEIVVRRYSSKQIDALHGNLPEQACCDEVMECVEEYTIEHEVTWEVGDLGIGGSVSVRW